MVFADVCGVISLKKFQISQNKMTEDKIKFKLTVLHSFSNLNLSLTFTGSSKVGSYSLLLPRNNGERHSWENISLKSSDWKTLCNMVRMARLNDLPIEEIEHGWMMLDGGDFTIETLIDNKKVIRTRSVMPERRFCVVINKMIDLIPQLDKQITPKHNLKDNYRFEV